jgi:integrase
LLQKSIRRSETDIAQRAALTLFKLKGAAIWRRLMVIAFEDVGIGSLDVVTTTVCPAEALDGWLQESSIADGPLFRRVSKTGKILAGRLSAATVANIVKGHVRKIDLDPARYSGHSLRAGFATSAAAAGLPTWKIKQQTGHVSDGVVGRYIRELNSIDDVAALWPPSPNLTGEARPVAVLTGQYSLG